MSRSTDRRINTLQVMPHLIFGGTEFHVLRQLRRSDRAEFTHTVCYLTPKADLRDRYHEAGIQTICIDHAGPATAVRTILRLVRIVRERAIDVIHTHSRFDRLYGQIAARICGVPVVNTMHSMYVAERYRITREGAGNGPRPLTNGRLAIEDWLERRTVRHVVAVSEDVRNTWTAHPESSRVAGGRVSVVYAGVDFEQFDHSKSDPEVAALAEHLGVADAFPLLVNVARLQEGKSQVSVVPVMRALLERWPGAKAVIVGEGPQRGRIESAVREAGLEGRVLLAGARSDIPHFLALADVFLFPSHNEGFPHSVLEAVAAGVPVVAYDLPPLARLFQGPLQAALVKTGEVDALARAAVEVVSDLSTWRERARVGRSHARESYDAERWTRELEGVYRSVIGRTPYTAGAEPAR